MVQLLPAVDAGADDGLVLPELVGASVPVWAGVVAAYVAYVVGPDAAAVVIEAPAGAVVDVEPPESLAGSASPRAIAAIAGPGALKSPMLFQTIGHL